MALLDNPLVRDAVYNVLLLCVDAGVLAVLWRRRDPTTTGLWLGGHVAATFLCAVVIAAGADPSMVARLFDEPVKLRVLMYSVARLACWGLFLHAPFVAAALAWSRRQAGYTASASLLCLSAAALVCVAYDAFELEPDWLQVSRYEIVSPKVDRPVRVVVVADLQTDSVGEYERRALRRALSEQPDLLLFAGDYIQIRSGASWQERWSEQAALLRDALAEIDIAPPLGAFAVGGNVDGPHWPICFFDTGVEPVAGTRSFDLGPLTLTCLQTFDSFRPNIEIEDFDKFQIVLGHSPNYSLGENDADLLIAGHLHGGQVQIPGFGPIVIMADVPRSWSTGMTEIAYGKRLLVSRGVGMERGDAPPIRFCCRPEIVVVDILPAEDGRP